MRSLLVVFGLVGVLSSAARAAQPELSEYSVQIGLYESVRNARATRGFLESIAPARVEGINNEKGERQYRVLLGRFKNAEAAEDFIREHHLKKFFPKQWVNPVRIDHREVNEKVDQSQAPKEEKTDPYQLNVNLYCPTEGTKSVQKGEYKALLTPDPDLKGSDVRLGIAWECAPPGGVQPPPPVSAPPVPEKTFDENEKNPTYYALSVIGGFNSVSATHDTLGEVSRSGLAYGAQLSLFRNLGSIGPVAEYRFLNRRHTVGTNIEFSSEHRIAAGLRLMMLKQLDIEPVVGFYSLGFVSVDDAGSQALVAQMTPMAGIRARKVLLEPKNGTSIDASVGYHQLFSTTQSTFNTLTGYLITGQLRTRHFFPSAVGGDWFIEYNIQNQGTTRSTQSEMYFQAGLTIYLLGT